MRLRQLALCPRHDCRAGWLIMLVASLLLAGCGYSHKELFPTDVRTVAVPIFENRTFYQGVEFDLTEAVIKEIERRTPYKVVASDRADTLLRGRVVAVEQRTLSQTREAGMPEEVEARVVVDFSWTAVSTGQTIRDRQGFAAVGRYIPARPLGEPLEIAQHEAVQMLARDIVSTLRADW